MNATKEDFIQEVVDDLIESMSLKDLVSFANMDETSVQVLQKALELYISRKVGPESENYEVPEIMDALWEKIKETHRIRIVK